MSEENEEPVNRLPFSVGVTQEPEPGNCECLYMYENEMGLGVIIQGVTDVQENDSRTGEPFRYTRNCWHASDVTYWQVHFSPMVGEISHGWLFDAPDLDSARTIGLSILGCADNGICVNTE